MLEGFSDSTNKKIDEEMKNLTMDEEMKSLTRINFCVLFVTIILVACSALDFSLPKFRNITYAGMGGVVVLTILLGSIIVFSKKSKAKKIEVYVALLLSIVLTIGITNSIKTKLAVKKLIQAEAQIAELKEFPKDAIKKTRDKVAHYIKHNYKKVPDTVVYKIADEMLDLSNKEGVPVPILIGIISVESNFNPSSASTKLARGLMQVRWNVWKTDLKKNLKLENQFDLHNIKEGMQAGIYVFKHYMKKNNGDISIALYNYVGKDRNYVAKVYKAIGSYVTYGGPKDELKVQKLSGQ